MSSFSDSERPGRTTLVPVEQAVESAVRLGREAVYFRPWIGDRGPEVADRFERAVRSRSAVGTLLYVDGVAVGVALWNPPGPLGITLDLWHVVPAMTSTDRYRWFLEAIRRTYGPVVFVPGEIPGLAPADEERLMTGLGYGRFGRSEMRRTPDAPLPSLELPGEGSLRPVTRDDEAALIDLHARAYHERFDRYLFLEDPDERSDARHLVQSFFDGKWGEWSAAGSQAVTRGGELLGAVLAVRRGPGALLIDVMVEPSAQGGGIGRALLAGTIRSLVAQGEVPIALNVTEGNSRALRLYARLGFVRTLGPSRDWYDRDRIPVAPERD